MFSLLLDGMHEKKRSRWGHLHDEVSLKNDKAGEKLNDFILPSRLVYTGSDALDCKIRKKWIVAGYIFNREINCTFSRMYQKQRDKQ